jgi:hypothetical protein
MANLGMYTDDDRPAHFIEAWVWEIYENRNKPSSSFHGEAGGKFKNTFRFMT